MEKPFTTTLEQADAAIAAAEKNGLKLMVAENMRFVKAYEVAHQFVKEGGSAEICYARGYTGGSEVTNLSDPNNWLTKSSEAGGGVMLDAGVHIFYLFRWMVGEVKSIHAVTTKFLKELPGDIEDNAAGSVKFANGGVGVFGFSDTTGSPLDRAARTIWYQGFHHGRLSIASTSSGVLDNQTIPGPWEMVGHVWRRVLASTLHRAFSHVLGHERNARARSNTS